MRKKYSQQAFEHTAIYDLTISKWIAKKIQFKEASWLQKLPLKQELRYGENPHQKASWYGEPEKGWSGANQLQGKELSTNNLLDLEAALSTLREFGYKNTINNDHSYQKAAVVIKHTNPCGVAIGDSTFSALKRALDSDRVSAFGGIIAINCPVDEAAAKELKNIFIECVVAPYFDKNAKEILSKKKNLRLLELKAESIQKADKNHIRSILGGLLIQDLDEPNTDQEDWQTVTNLIPTEREINDLSFAWKVVKHIRSNAIAVAANGQSLGIGAGQMNRVGSAKLALEAAGNQSKGAVLASDGFFPFDDTVKMAADYGISSIIQPGGSIRDKDSIKACNELGLKMVLTGKRHFLH